MTSGQDYCQYDCCWREKAVGTTLRIAPDFENRHCGGVSGRPTTALLGVHLQYGIVFDSSFAPTPNLSRLSGVSR